MTDSFSGLYPGARTQVIGYTFISGGLNAIANFTPFTSMYGANVARGPLGY